MGPGAPNMSAVGLPMLLVLVCVIVSWGVSWRFLICRSRIYALPWYFSHPVAMIGGLFGVAIYIAYFYLTISLLESVPRSVVMAMGGIWSVLVLLILPIPVALFIGVRKGYLSEPTGTLIEQQASDKKLATET